MLERFPSVVYWAADHTDTGSGRHSNDITFSCEYARIENP